MARKSNGRASIGDWQSWPIERPKPYPNNARTHPQSQINLLAELLKKFGPDQPIVVDEHDVILKGHGRRLAALAAGMTHFPVVQRFGLSAEDKAALRIADNQVALLAGWDQDLIRVELGTLQQAGYDLQTLAFPEVALRGWGFLAGGSGQEDPDVVPEPPKKPTVRAGDLWVLDHHRVACGDSTSRDVWKQLFEAERASMVFTDPPYGVSYHARSGEFQIIEGDEKRGDDLYKMLLKSMREMERHAAEGAAFYIWHASSTRVDFEEAMKSAGIVERQYLIWVKPAIVLGHSDYRWQHEPCFYASKAERSPKFYGERAESTVWRVDLVAGKDTASTIGNGLVLVDGAGGTLFIQSKAPKTKKLRQIRVAQGSNVFLSGIERSDGTVWEVARDGRHEHPTQKPVELARRAIENSSQPGEIVADGFLGSGTTLIGAEMTARRCYAIDIDPTYVEVAIRRWERFTGKQAFLNGQTLDEVAKARRRGLPKGTIQTKGSYTSASAQ